MVCSPLLVEPCSVPVDTVDEGEEQIFLFNLQQDLEKIKLWTEPEPAPLKANLLSLAAPGL